MARTEKVEAVKEIAARFEEADATLLTEYRGLKVGEIADVRGALREANADYKVLKNTLARIAVREAGLEDLAEWLEGPTAIVFVKGDVVEAAKALDEAAKKYPVLVVKGGSLKGGKLIGADDARSLAKLDSRDVLLTKIAMLFNQPAQLTANVLSALLRDLGSMLGQVVAKKESGELPGGEAPVEAAPEAQTTSSDEGEAPAEAEEAAQEPGGDDATDDATEEEAKPEGDTETPEAPEASAEEPEQDQEEPEQGQEEATETGSETEDPTEEEK